MWFKIILEQPGGALDEEDDGLETMQQITVNEEFN